MQCTACSKYWCFEIKLLHHSFKCIQWNLNIIVIWYPLSSKKKFTFFSNHQNFYVTSSSFWVHIFNQLLHKHDKVFFFCLKNLILIYHILLQYYANYSGLRLQVVFLNFIITIISKDRVSQVVVVVKNTPANAGDMKCGLNPW